MILMVMTMVLMVMIKFIIMMMIMIYFCSNSGRKEIWDALKAAALALEQNDHALAQVSVTELR